MFNAALYLLFFRCCLVEFPCSLEMCLGYGFSIKDIVDPDYILSKIIHTRDPDLAVRCGNRDMLNKMKFDLLFAIFTHLHINIYSSSLKHLVPLHFSFCSHL